MEPLTDKQKEIYESLWSDLRHMYRTNTADADNGIPFRSRVETFMRELQAETPMEPFRCNCNNIEPQPPVYRVFKDGNAWCAVTHEFVDLMQSPAAFGDTPVEALQRFLFPLPDDYHPNLDGPSEPVGLAMPKGCICEPDTTRCPYDEAEEDRANRQAARELLNCGQYR